MVESSKRQCVAVDIGGSHIRTGLVSEAGISGVHDRSLNDIARLEPLLPSIAHQIHRLVEESDCCGLAISFPGIVNDGQVLSTMRGKFADAPDLDLAGWAKSTFGLKLAIENDARMALLGEFAAGAAKDCRDVVMLTVGTGVGSAVMINGTLLRGGHYQAGCLGGHIPVRFDGRPCICGAIGCVEAEASTWALNEIAREHVFEADGNVLLPTRLDFATVFNRSASGDVFMQKLRDHCLQIWGAGLIGLIHAYDPTVVILGGGVMAAKGQILPALSAHVERHAFTWWGRPELRAATLGADAALYGALTLMDELQ